MLNAVRETRNVVTVVPIFAPIIQAQAWKRVMIPISANLTSVTDVTSEDWTIAVLVKPAITPRNLFLQMYPLVKNEPALSEARVKPLDIKLTPTKKQPHAVKTSMTAKMVSKIGCPANVTNIVKT